MATACVCARVHVFSLYSALNVDKTKFRFHPGDIQIRKLQNYLDTRAAKSSETSSQKRNQNFAN